jgi:peroxiredoxin
MRILKKLSIALALAFMWACSSEPKLETFVLSGKLQDLKDNSVLVGYLDQDLKQKVDTIKVTNGAFSHSLSSVGGQVYNFLLMDSQQSFSVFLETEPSEIVIQKDSLENIKVVKGASQEDLLAIRKIEMAMTTNLQTLWKDAESYGEQNPDKYPAYEDSLRKITTTTQQTYIAQYQSFIDSHKKSVPALGFFGRFMTGDYTKDKALYELFDIDVRKNSVYGKQLQQMFDKEASTAIGVKAKDFSQTDTQGKNVSLADYKGKYVLIDFWASWCGPCRAENPNVVTAYEKYKDKGFDILGVSLDEDREAWLKAIATDKLMWKQVSDLKGWDNAVSKQYGVESIPANFLLDKEGVIVAKGLRGADLERKLEEVLK